MVYRIVDFENPFFYKTHFLELTIDIRCDNKIIEIETGNPVSQYVKIGVRKRAAGLFI